MALPTIFCPQCSKLIFEAKDCPACNWHRPLVTGKAGKPNWAVALEVKLPSKESHPAVINDLICVPTHGGQIVALDTHIAEPENSVKWRYQLEPNYYCYSVMGWEQFLLLGIEYLGDFPAPQGALILLSTVSGEEVWRYPIEGASISVPVVCENIAFFTTNMGWLYAVDLLARQEIWRHKLEASWSWSPAPALLTPDHLLVLPSRSGQIVAFDLAKREVKWIFTADGWFPHTPAWKDQIIYTRCWDRHVYAIDAAQGREIWRNQAPRDYSSDLWVGEKYLFIGAKDYVGEQDKRSSAYALYSLDQKTGERLGRYAVDGHILGRPTATNEFVFFATDNRTREIESQGTLYALNVMDIERPELLWEPCVVEQRFQSDLLLVDDWIIAGTRQGAIYAVRWRAVETVVEAPAFYIEQESWEDAAIAYALQAEYIQAAEIYATKAGQPLHAAQLYLHARAYQLAIELLGQSEVEEERKIAIEAAHRLPLLKDRAEALYNLGDSLAAGRVYEEIQNWDAAGKCYEEAQTLNKAREAYKQARNLKKWDALSRRLNEWKELAEHYFEAGSYDKAAEIYAQELSLPLKAAQCYDQAGSPMKALEAYRQVSLDEMTNASQLRLAELAFETGEIKLAIGTYASIGELSKAADLAESAGFYQQALKFYEEVGNILKVAEMLEKLGQFLEASELFEKLNLWGRAAENLENQVELIIERAGGLRFIRDDRGKIEAWLARAIELSETEIEEPDSENGADKYDDCINRCRQKLARLRKEPILKVSFYTDNLSVNQSSVVKYVVKNVGWGIARNLSLALKSPQLQYEVPLLTLDNLLPGKETTSVFTITPIIPGAIMLHLEFYEQLKTGELIEMSVQGAREVILEAQAEAGIEPVPSRGLSNWWQANSSGSSSRSDTEIVSRSKLNQQLVNSLQQQLTQHRTNLLKLQEDKAIYAAGEVPLRLHNQIQAEKREIEELEARLLGLSA